MENIGSTDNEKVIIQTLKDPFWGGYLKTINITFYTSDLGIYSGWYHDLTNSPTVFTVRDNFHNSYNFTYQNNKSINVGFSSKNVTNTYIENHNNINYGGSAQNLQADKGKMLYYVSMNYSIP